VAGYRALVGGVINTKGKTDTWAIRQWECNRDGEIKIIPYDRSRLDFFIAHGELIEVSDPALSPQATPGD
jgi:hypothetical protein